MKILFIGARLFDDVSEYCLREGIETVLSESNSDSNNLDLADKYYIVPRGMEGPKEIAIKEDVDAIVPLIGIDGPLMDLAILKEEIETDYGIPVITANYNATSISNDKIKTKNFFLENKIKTPDFYLESYKNKNLSNNYNLKDEDAFSLFLNKNDLNYPFVLKQAIGQGGKDIKVINSGSDAVEYFLEYDSSLIEKYVNGYEVSIEVLSYKNEYFPLVPVFKGMTTLEGTHPLNKTRSAPLGIENVINEDIRKLASSIAKKLDVESTMDIDLIVDFETKDVFVIELNTRPSGTRYLSSAASGINPLYSVIDMARGEFKYSKLEKSLKNYYSLEIPVGNFNGFRFKNKSNGKPSKEFLKPNSWVVHGPKDYERITISAETKNKAFKIAEELNVN